MNKILSLTVIFLAGVGVGFLVSQKLLEQKYATLAEEEIKSVKETFSKNLKSCFEEGPVESTKAEDFRKASNFTAGLTRSSINMNPYEKAKRNYVGAPCHDELFVPIYEEDEEEDDEDEESELITDSAGMTEEDIDDVDKNNPYIITYDEFTDTREDYEKVSLYYYTLDDTLIDEDNSIIHHIEQSVGYDALSLLNLEAAVWVRNEPLRIDYEIIAINNKPYTTAIHGFVVETPRERYLRDLKKKQKE